MKALDISGGAAHVTSQWCADRIAEHYQLLVCNLWGGASSYAKTEQALQLWRAAGGLTSGYYVPHAYQTASHHLNAAVAAAGSEWDYLGEGLPANMPAVWIDVEDIRAMAQKQAGHYPMPDQWTAAHLQESIDLVRSMGKAPGIYTNGAAWNPAQLGNGFSDLPLWVADYNLDPAIDLRFPFGGWSVAFAKQWQGTTDLSGVAVDISTFPDVAVPDVVAPDVVAPGPGRAGEAELSLIWAALDAAEHALTDPVLMQQMEDAKQQGVVPLKALLGL